MVNSLKNRRRAAATPLPTSTVYTERTSRLTPRMRRQAVAYLLANGVLRLRQRVAAPQKGPQNSPVQGLELSDETVLSVSRGVNGPESSQFSRSTT